MSTAPQLWLDLESQPRPASTARKSTHHRLAIHSLLNARLVTSNPSRALFFLSHHDTRPRRVTFSRQRQVSLVPLRDRRKDSHSQDYSFFISYLPFLSFFVFPFFSLLCFRDPYPPPPLYTTCSLTPRLDLPVPREYPKTLVANPLALHLLHCKDASTITSSIRCGFCTQSDLSQCGLEFKG